MEFVRGRGRRARDEVRVLPYALGGEKSVNGGIYGPSVAPHLNRRFLREVRSEFSSSAMGAAYSDACGRGGRAARSFASFVTFLSNKEKLVKPHFGKGNGDCAQAEVRAEMRTAEDVGPYNVKSIPRADGSYVEGER